MVKKIVIGIVVVAVIVIILTCAVVLNKDNTQNNKQTNNNIIEYNEVIDENLSQINETEGEDKLIFIAEVTDVGENSITVQAVDGEELAVATGTIVVRLGSDDNQVFNIGDTVEIIYNGEMKTSLPAQIDAIRARVIK